MEVRIKRVYAEPDVHDWDLVDRLWPRGIVEVPSENRSVVA